MLSIGKEADDGEEDLRTGRGVDGRPGRRYELTDDGLGADRAAAAAPGARGGKLERPPDGRSTGSSGSSTAGAQWRDMPERYGKWQSGLRPIPSVDARRACSTSILRRLHVQLDDEGRIDWSVFDVDGSSVRAHRAASGASKKTGSIEPRDHALGRSRGGFGTKLHLVTDRRGVPLGRARDGGAGPRVHELRGADGHREHPAAPQTPGGRSPATRGTATRGSGDGWPGGGSRPSSRRGPISPASGSTRTSTAAATSSSGASAGSRRADAWRPGTRSSPATTWPWSSSP